ncbi:hypothetical protein NPS40_24690, partial [Escherichia coli]|uniref:hypothetical protein n=1 Tax=Escherichia coli TaxID=562 RepID=UPI002114B618
MGSCAAPSAKGDDKFITTDYLQQCQKKSLKEQGLLIASEYKKKLEEFTFSLRITVQSNNNQQK